MKFLMKLAIDGISPPENALRFRSSPADRLLSGFLRIVKKLNRPLYGQNTRLLKKKVNKPEIDWMPIIKATTHIENGNAHCDLKGRSILCVGGQAKHYPIYRDLVEAAGGHLVTFYGDSNDSIEQLHQRLEKADMVICPIDCVNHQAYFTVKRYCQFSGKYCVLLHRSQAGVFQKGIERLVSITAIKRIND